MKVTLGGERLGSGKKMQVDLDTYNRSSFDTSRTWRSTMAQGTLVPCLCKVGLTGGVYDIEVDVNAMTHPTIGPMLGSSKLEVHFFTLPIRLYQAQLQFNKTNVGLDMAKVKLPQITMETYDQNDNDDLDNSQINPSSIWAYLGIRGVGKRKGLGDEVIKRDFNAIPYLGYWDIYKNYYANKQEEIGAVIHYDANQGIQLPFDDIGIWRDTSGGGRPNIEIPLNSTGGSAPFNNSYELVLTAYEELLPRDFERVGEEMGVWVTIGGQLRALTLNEAFGNVMRGSTLNEVVCSGVKLPTAGGVLHGYGFTAEMILDLSPNVRTFPLKNLDEMREDIITAVKQTSPFMVDKESLAPYGWALETNPTKDVKKYSQEGLAIKAYNSDLFNNWLSSEWIDGDDGINSITAVDVSDGELKLDALILAKKVYKMLNNIAVSGGQYHDWLKASYGYDKITDATTPIYNGGVIRQIAFQEIVSNSASEGSDGNQPLGTLAGKGVVTDKKSGGKVIIKCEEPSYIIGIVSITPNLDYSQGNRWDVDLKTMNDFHVPALDQVGFQELITEQMAWWDTTIDPKNQNKIEKRSAGKQPAWINYQTAVNEVRGNFAIRDNQMFMVMDRRYERGENGHIQDLTTYIDPAKFNHIFADTARDAQNYWVQIRMNMTDRLLMSSKVMPNL